MSAVRRLSAAVPLLLAQHASAQVLTTQTTVVSTGKAGYITYQVAVGFDTGVRDVYALYGEEDDGPSIHRGMIVPPAYQVAAPFGTDIGPVNPAFFVVAPDCEYDSFLTIGIDGPALMPGALSSIGLDFASWTDRSGITSSDGAVFFMDPDHGATSMPVVFAQLTVPTATHFTGQINAQGRSTVGDDWHATGIVFSDTGGGVPAPAPAPGGKGGGGGGGGGGPVVADWTPPIDCVDANGVMQQGCAAGSGAAALARNVGSADPAGIPTRQIAQAADGSPVMMPVISLGAAHFGADTVAVVQQWLAFGGTGIDTSGDYRTQPDVGTALAASRVNRGSVFLTSKLSQDGMASYDAALSEVQRTLDELQTDYIDLFLIHRAGDSAAQRRETWRAMQYLRDTGIVRAIGVSNWFVSRSSVFVSLYRCVRLILAIVASLSPTPTLTLTPLSDRGTGRYCP
eukprot:COSAG06_NODE_2007_length_7858_cov_23.947158_8_plen_455_part_00